MIIQKTGAITPELHVLGSIDLPAFLLDAKSPAIIDAGMSLMGKKYIREARELLDGQGPGYLFLTHAHYDHCGAAAILKQAFPEIKICCSAEGAGVLERPRAIETIKALNRSAAEYFAEMGEEIPDTAGFEPFAVDHTLSDGETVELGPDLSLCAIATPGHTRDSMSFYVPEKKMLFTGEAMGIMDPSGYIFSEWLSDYDQYFESMKKLTNLDVDILCPGHGHVITGKDVADYMTRAIEYGIWFRELIEETLEQTRGDTEAAKQRIKQKEYDPVPEPKQPEFAYMLNLEAKIRAVKNIASN
ncbi:MAG: MBL fold metallo-hydrolase [Desulfobacterales bacterium]